ncbi:MAG: ABC-2 family transporter protein [DPANN group archaeon]|nr:ABC-2 family transporter protein [DPANN group archaeon]
MNVIKVWLNFASISLQHELAYRTNFIIKLVADGLFSFMLPIVAAVIYSNSKGLPGWSFEQLLLMQGISVLAFGISSTIFGRFAEHTVQDVRNGTFDMKMIRPTHPLLYQLATSCRLDGLASAFSGVAILLYAAGKLGLAFSVQNMAAFLIILFLSQIFLLSLEIMIASLAFLVVRSFILLDFFYSLTSMGDYPLNIYGGFGLMVFTFIVPIGLASFYPAMAILGQLSLTKIAELTVVAFAFFGFSLMLWNLGIKQYKSAGG